MGNVTMEQVYGMRKAVELYKAYRERASEDDAIEKVLDIAGELESGLSLNIEGELNYGL